MPAIRTRNRYFLMIQFHQLSITVNKFKNLQILLVVFDEFVQLIINKLTSKYQPMKMQK